MYSVMQKASRILRSLAVTHAMAPKPEHCKTALLTLALAVLKILGFAVCYFIVCMCTRVHVYVCMCVSDGGHMCCDMREEVRGHSRTSSLLLLLCGF